MKRIILIHGNSGGTASDIWFPSVKTELEAANLTVIARDFPDNDLARASYWIPFLLDEIKVDENTVLVGHSSGAIVAMRVAEMMPLLGTVLVGTYHTDLGMEKEKQAGYFDKPWDWEAMRRNQKWSVVFASQDDPWIPIEEPCFIQSKLNCEYHEYKDQGHFGGDYNKLSFPELSLAVIRNINPSVKTAY